MKSRVLAITAILVAYLMVAGATYSFSFRACSEAGGSDARCELDAGLSGMSWPIYWPWIIGMKMVSP